MTKLREMRELRKLKQSELAVLAGVKNPTVNVLESKGIYDTRTACKYAKALNCHPLFLLEGLDKVI